MCNDTPTSIKFKLLLYAELIIRLQFIYNMHYNILFPEEKSIQKCIQILFPRIVFSILNTISFNLFCSFHSFAKSCKLNVTTVQNMRTTVTMTWQMLLQHFRSPKYDHQTSPYVCVFDISRRKESSKVAFCRLVWQRDARNRESSNFLSKLNMTPDLSNARSISPDPYRSLLTTPYYRPLPSGCRSR